MKKFILFLSLPVCILLITSCCDCEQGRITDQLDTFRTLQNVKKDLFYFKMNNGSVYKMKKVKPDSVEYSPEDSAEPTSSLFQQVTSLLFSSAFANPANHCKTGEDCDGEIFAGQDRKKAKTSTYHGTLKHFDNVGDILKWLPSDDDMRKNHEPKISTACDCGRTPEEQYAVKIESAYLYGIYREKDNDFHVIIGNGDWGGSSMKLLNIEIGALPDDETSADYARLSRVRDRIIQEFGELQCGNGAYKPVDELIPISVEGSLFYDIDHPAGNVGFTSDGVKVKPKTAWEIHPVTKISFL
jgi:hypothetical protein